MTRTMWASVRFPVVFLLISLLAGCSKRSAVTHAAPSEPAASAPASAAAQAESAAARPALPAGRAMRRDVHMRLHVGHRDAAVQSLRATLADFEGYVMNASVSGEDAGGVASLDVRVPAARVESFRAAVRSLGSVTEDVEHAEDVTEARADLGARLENARTEEARLSKMLAERTGNLSDVLAVEKELARVRETVERFQAEHDALEGEIAMAKVSIEMDTAVVTAPPTAAARIAAAAREGVETGEGVVLGTAIFLLSSGPTLLFLCAIAYVCAKVGRRVLRRVREGQEVV